MGRVAPVFGCSRECCCTHSAVIYFDIDLDLGTVRRPSFEHWGARCGDEGVNAAARACTLYAGMDHRNCMRTHSARTENLCCGVRRTPNFKDGIHRRFLAATTIRLLK